MSKFYNLLDNHSLWNEVRSLLDLSNPAYHYWNETHHIKLNRYLFLENSTLPQKYLHVLDKTTNLSGYLPVGYVSNFLNVDAHIFNTKQMRLYNKFEYKFVQGVKFVNIRKFFVEHGIEVKKDSLVHLVKIEEATILSNTRLYNIDGKYAVVVYD